jgi:dTDP-4-amino-4,6-dideoxygalactose transaminase/acetyltransferase-like isoleucine patch superfamily enzyme
VIGDGCNIGQNVVVGPDVTIGAGCKIQNNVSVYKGVTLEADVFCGPSMVFTNVFNPRAHVKRMDEVRPTLVKQGASFGANCTVVCGVTVGRYALVGAGAVVTKDVPYHALVMGNPARQAGWMCECGEKLNPELACGACGKSYPWLEPMAFVDLAAQQKRLLPKIEAGIKAVLGHGNYIMGPEVGELERALARFSGARHVVSCASGTDALLMALMALGVGPGDAVFTSSFTFVASAEVIRLVGATPVFVDIDPATFNLSAGKLREAVAGIRASRRDLRPRAVIPVDLFGLPCDYDAVGAVALEHGMEVIEDAAQSFGARCGEKVAGTFGLAGCTSFFPAKPLGCYGDGGAVFTDSDDLAEKLVSIRVHGKGRDKYDNVRTGINGRLDTLQAAILLPKLEIFQEELHLRQRAAEVYTGLLAGTGLTLPAVPEGRTSSWAQYSVLARNGEERDHFQASLRKSGVPTAVYYPTPLHLQTAFADLGYARGSLPVSEDAASRIFSLPMHPYLSAKDQERVAEAVKRAAACAR